MFSIFQNLGPELPFTLILLALLGLRARVTPRASLWVNASPEKLWALIDLYDGKIENWGRTTVKSKLINAETRSYRKTFITALSNGTMRPFTADFRIAQREPEKYIELARDGLGGKSENNELLKITHQITAENNGTRLTSVYYWGSRTLLAQLLARADLWGGAYRLKGLAETGIPNERPHLLISLGVTLLTGLLTIGAFGAMMGLTVALLLVVALFVHEFGHLVAYKLMGQPWGRMVFLPFLGAVAMPRLPYESQGQSVFAALMGPGFSVILALACAVPYLIDGQLHPYLVFLGIVTAGLNIFNMLPAEPLDGGVALRTVLTRLAGDYAHYGLMAIGIILALVGIAIDQVVLVIFGGMACVVNLKPRKFDAQLTPLTALQTSISTVGYTTIVFAHLTLLHFFMEQLNLLNV